MKSYKILAVDDQEDILQIVKAVLERELECEVITIQEPQKALEALQLQFFDLIITDIRMPLMDGYEFLEKLQERSFSRPILVLTGDMCDSEKLVDQNVHILMKPLDLRKFSFSVQEILKTIK